MTADAPLSDGLEAADRARQARGSNGVVRAGPRCRVVMCDCRAVAEPRAYSLADKSRGADDWECQSRPLVFGREQDMPQLRARFARRKGSIAARLRLSISHMKGCFLTWLPQAAAGRSEAYAKRQETDSLWWWPQQVMSVSVRSRTASFWRVQFSRSSISEAAIAS